MDKKIANNVVLGVFVLIGFGAFIFLIFNLGGGSGVFSRNVALFGRFNQVKGLHYGSEVSLAGLRIGTVKDIKIAKDDTKELIVELSIASRHFDQIRTDSVARIATQGLLGDKYVEITIGSPAQPIVKPDSFIPTSEIEDFFTKGGGLVSDIDKQFQKGGSVDLLLQNMNKVANNLAVITHEAAHGKGLLHEVTKGESGKRVEASTAHLESILGKVDRGEGTLGALVNDPSVFEDLKTVMGGAKRSTVLQYFMKTFMEDGTKAKASQKK